MGEKLGKEKGRSDVDRGAVDRDGSSTDVSTKPREGRRKREQKKRKHTEILIDPGDRAVLNELLKYL